MERLTWHAVHAVVITRDALPRSVLGHLCELLKLVHHLLAPTWVGDAKVPEMLVGLLLGMKEDRTLVLRDLTHVHKTLQGTWVSYLQVFNLLCPNPVRSLRLGVPSMNAGASTFSVSSRISLGSQNFLDGPPLPFKPSPILTVEVLLNSTWGCCIKSSFVVAR